MDKLKAGLEVHQQLDTGKLFCRCKSILRNDEPMIVLKRRMSLVAGETEDIDEAAKHEVAKGLEYVYEAYDTNCLVELDEEPPHEIDSEALKISIQVCLLLNCSIFPVTQVMRKIVVDGSNTSGFQRTVLIGHDGFIETSGGRVGIETVALEEDSARKIRSEGGKVVYRLDRLGIPLVEITTKPDLKSPEQIKEAALKIGEILRSCQVRRGIGTIRQDLNISVSGGKRVEIKGFQDPRTMIRVVQNEVMRQKECIRKGVCKSEVRRALPDGITEFLRPMPGASRMYPETDLPLLKIPKKIIDLAKKTLPKLMSEHKAYLREFGLNDELIRLVLKDKKLEEFKTLTKVMDNYSLIAKSLTIFPRELSRKTGKSMEETERALNVHVLERVLEEVGRNISPNDVKNVLEKILRGQSVEKSLEKSDVNFKEEIRKILKEKPGLSKGAYMGLLMSKFRGVVSGKEISDELDKHLLK
ncbi:Glu-tRNA(Gln) amidotransferase GatDE subunit E [Candidatus Pacearchaeota archaeon]|nr:MAG: Glu-tRNA(Gln) amidotransferase GatDE subunit E [Candidatus Pacearchaeota archaeon]